VFEEVSARLLHAEERLARALAPLAATFDFAILDCPPRADGVLSENAVRAADTAVLVIEAGAFALQGAIKARALLLESARLRERPLAVRAVGTMFDKRSKIGRELMIGMHAQFGTLLFDTAIRSSARLRECAAVGLPVQVLDPRSKAAGDFRALALEVWAYAESAASPDAGHREAAEPR
jgi:chromosome partitioning protein